MADEILNMAKQKAAKDNDLIIECGREMALDLLKSAVHDAKDDEQRGNQVFMLTIMASHILATLAINLEHNSNGKMPAAKYLKGIFEDVEREIEFIKGDMELHSIEKGEPLGNKKV